MIFIYIIINIFCDKMQNNNLQNELLFPNYTLFNVSNVPSVSLNQFSGAGVLNGINGKIIEGLDNNIPANTLNSIVQQSLDISNNINNLYVEMQKNMENDILDENGNLTSKGRLVDVARQDTQIMLIQQNTLYMLGTITIATLLITSIMLSK